MKFSLKRWEKLMKKSNIAGWKDVLAFTFVQTFKSKAFIISYILLILLAALSMPIISMLTSGGSKDINAPSPIKKVYIENKSTLPEVDLSGLLKENKFHNTSFTTMKEAYDKVSKRIESNENASVILTITENKGAYSLAFKKAAKGPVKENDLQVLGTDVEKQFKAFKIKALQISDQQVSMINAKVDTKVSLLDSTGKAIVKKDTTISGTEYWFIYGLLFVVLMVNIMASTQIATSIVTEKSTKVIEYLLITVRPLALMVGKIIAMLSAVLIQMVSLVVVLFVSNKVSAVINPGSSENMLAKYLPSNIFQNINIVNIIICLIVIILGMLFYATLAGLAGATVSRIEATS
jgi:ABC-2 type transport system permease protein